jgi:hypothetical protein
MMPFFYKLFSHNNLSLKKLIPQNFFEKPIFLIKIFIYIKCKLGYHRYRFITQTRAHANIGIMAPKFKAGKLIHAGENKRITMKTYACKDCGKTRTVITKKYI